MAYHRYITEGIVLTSRPSGERDVVCSILTEDLGSIFATARSARMPHSKMSQGIQESSLSKFSFIRGMHGWKIVGVQNDTQLYRDLNIQPESKKVLARILKFLRKIVSGEVKHPELFDIVRATYNVMVCDTYTKEELFIIECITLLRILNQLGHIGVRDEYQEFINGTGISKQTLIQCAKLKTQLVYDINHALTSST